jgi:hypothetical protein
VVVVVAAVVVSIKPPVSTVAVVKRTATIFAASAVMVAVRFAATHATTVWEVAVVVTVVSSKPPIVLVAGTALLGYVNCCLNYAATRQLTTAVMFAREIPQRSMLKAVILRRSKSRLPMTTISSTFRSKAVRSRTMLQR